VDHEPSLESLVTCEEEIFFIVKIFNLRDYLLNLSALTRPPALGELIDSSWPFPAVLVDSAIKELVDQNPLVRIPMECRLLYRNSLLERKLSVLIACQMLI
jgi:hypothetical protein